MAAYLKTRKAVLDMIKEGRVADAKKRIREELKAIKELRAELKSEYTYANGKTARHMDEGAQLKMRRYSSENKFFTELGRGIRQFEQQLKAR